MKITIDEDVCKKYGLSLPEVLGLLLVKSVNNPYVFIEQMIGKSLLKKTENGDTLVYQGWDDVCSSILLDSDNSIPDDDTMESLSKELIEMFPKGKKEGTNLYWRGNVKDTKLRLKKFFKLYGNKFSPEEIIEATRKYVSSFNGDYSYMRVLKYFIWKDTRKVDAEGNGYVEESSDLATLIENKSDTVTNTDWTVDLR